jgi:hypothetical protein
MYKIKNLSITIAMLLFLLPFRNDVNGQITLEVNGGIGGTVVDVDAWSWGAADDWGQFLGEVSAAVIPLHFGKVSLGAEYCYHHLFWYSYRAPGYTYYIDVEIDASSLMAIVRTDITNNLFIDLGIGAFMFGDWTDFGMQAAVGYRIMLGEKLYIPVKLRTQIVLDEDANLYPVGLNFGVGYSL